jgi:hypothetical protein
MTAIPYIAHHGDTDSQVRSPSTLGTARYRLIAGRRPKVTNATAAASHGVQVTHVTRMSIAEIDV